MKRWLALILLAGAGLRLYTALHAPWYWDEGYVTEAALCLARGDRPQLGALWQDGFFPLSTTLLAPLSAAPFAALGGDEALFGARLWALLLDLLVIAAVSALGARLAGPWCGIAAAGAYALHPLAYEYGARAFYHHLPSLHLLIAGWLALKAAEEDSSHVAWLSAAFCGLALSASYWLWWAPLPLALAAGGGFKRRLSYLAAAGAASAALLALNFYPDPRGALWSARNLASLSGRGGPQSPAEFLGVLGSFLRSFPLTAAGLAGLALLAARARSARWLALIGAAAALEPLRQRGNIAGNPYPLILALPWLYLGLGALLSAAATRGRSAGNGFPAHAGPAGPGRLRLLAPLAAAAALLWPVDLGWLKAWSVEGPRALEMAGALSARARPGDKVMGLPNFHWLLRERGLSPFEISESAAWSGRQGGFYYPAGIPRSRFAYSCALEDARFAVTSRVHVMGVYLAPGAGSLFLQMEQEGWPLAWENRSFRAYENPRFGARPDPEVRILGAREWYQAALNDVEAAGLDGLAPLARRRLAGGEGKRP